MVFAGVSASSAGLLLLLLMVASRGLGQVEYGKLTAALALGMMFETLMDFGLHQVAIRAVARDRAAALRIFRNSLGLKLIWTLGAMAVLMVAATLMRPEWDVRLTCYLIGGSLVLRSYMLTVRGVLQGLEEFGWDSTVVVGDRLLVLVLGAMAIWMGYGLIGVAVAFVAARALALALTAALAKYRIGSIGIEWDLALWRELQVTAVPLGLFLVVLNIYAYVDTVLLNLIRGDIETGYYGNAYRVYEGLTYAPSILASVLTPRLALYFVSDRRRHRRYALGGVGASVLLALAMGGIAFAVAEPLMVFVFGPNFAPAAGPFRILTAGLSFVFALWIVHATAISMNRERLLLATGVVGLVVKVVANLILIPRFGMHGAAAATILSEGISLVFLGTGLVRRTSEPQPLES
jgi:O-antigen/teichoic acid export membrane protein